MLTTWRKGCKTRAGALRNPECPLELMFTVCLVPAVVLFFLVEMPRQAGIDVHRHSLVGQVKAANLIITKPGEACVIHGSPKYDAAWFLAIWIEIVDRHLFHPGFRAKSAKVVNVHADAFLSALPLSNWVGQFPVTPEGVSAVYCSCLFPASWLSTRQVLNTPGNRRSIIGKQFGTDG